MFAKISVVMAGVRHFLQGVKNLKFVLLYAIYIEYIYMMFFQFLYITWVFGGMYEVLYLLFGEKKQVVYFTDRNLKKYRPAIRAKYVINFIVFFFKFFI